jgi:hypothetical protein
MLLGLLISFLIPFSASAGGCPYGVPAEVGQTFKYPILGYPGCEVRPTQEAAGFLAVKVKRDRFSEMTEKELKKELKSEPIPVVKAPDERLYMIDHHHQALATYQTGQKSAYFKLEHDLSALSDMTEFWGQMKKNKWVREIDHRGLPLKIPEGLPLSVLKLKDDPYRSLAWFVRREGGYEKVSVEFAEFEWADFFRNRIKFDKLENGLKSTVKKAVKLAHSDEARNLPGWTPHKINCPKLFETK